MNNERYALVEYRTNDGKLEQIYVQDADCLSSHMRKHRGRVIEDGLREEDLPDGISCVNYEYPNELVDHADGEYMFGRPYGGSDHE